MKSGKSGFFSRTKIDPAELQASLFVALESKDTAEVMHLLEQRVDLLVTREGQRNFGHMTPLHLASHPDSYDQGVAKAMLKQLGPEGVRKNLHMKTSGGLLAGGTPLHWACRFAPEFPDLPQRMLKALDNREWAREALATPDALGRSPLEYLEGYGFTELAVQLREHFIDEPPAPVKGAAKAAAKAKSAEPAQGAPATNDATTH